MIKIYVGKNPESSSMYLVGKQLAEMCGGTIATHLADLKGVEDVICIVVEDCLKLLEGKRFVGFKNLHAFFAPNFEEFHGYALAGLAVAVAEGKIKTMIVHSEHTLRMWSDYLRKNFSLELWVAAKTRTRLVLWGISDEFLWNLKGRQPTEWLAPFNRINQTQKGIREHATLTEAMQSRYANIRTTLIYSGMTSGADPIDFPIYNAVPQGTRADYVATIARTGAFLCTSNYESFGIYYLELMASGVVGVFLDKPWVRLLLPDYELTVSKADLLPAMLSVAKDFKHWQEYLSGYVSQRFPAFKFSRVQADLLNALTENNP